MLGRLRAFRNRRGRSESKGGARMSCVLVREECSSLDTHTCDDDLRHTRSSEVSKTTVGNLGYRNGEPLESRRVPEEYVYRRKWEPLIDDFEWTEDAHKSEVRKGDAKRRSKRYSRLAPPPPLQVTYGPSSLRSNLTKPETTEQVSAAKLNMSLTEQLRVEQEGGGGNSNDEWEDVSDMGSGSRLVTPNTTIKYDAPMLPQQLPIPVWVSSPDSPPAKGHSAVKEGASWRHRRPQPLNLTPYAAKRRSSQYPSSPGTPGSAFASAFKPLPLTSAKRRPQSGSYRSPISSAASIEHRHSCSPRAAVRESGVGKDGPASVSLTSNEPQQGRMHTQVAHIGVSYAKPKSAIGSTGDRFKTGSKPASPCRLGATGDLLTLRTGVEGPPM